MRLRDLAPLPVLLVLGAMIGLPVYLALAPDPLCALGLGPAGACRSSEERVARLADDRWRERDAAALVYGRNVGWVTSEELVEALPRLVDLLRDPVAQVRGTAAFSLGRLGFHQKLDPTLHAADSVLPALAAASRDDDAQVRMNAVASIGHFCVRYPCAGAVEALRASLADPDGPTRVSAVISLGWIATPDDASAVADLDRLVHEGGRLERGAATTAIRQIHGEEAKPWESAPRR